MFNKLVYLLFILLFIEKHATRAFTGYERLYHKLKELNELNGK